MEALSRWMQQLAFLVLFAGFVEIALPSGEVRKAVRLVAGLVVMLAVVEPLAGWVTGPAAGWLDAFAMRTAIDGAAYIEAGEALARESAGQARELWKSQAERELGAMLGLVEGVRRAEVAIDLDERLGARGVSVRVWAEPGPSAGAGAERVISRVKGFLAQLFPQLGTEAVDVRIEEVEGGQR